MWPACEVISIAPDVSEQDFVGSSAAVRCRHGMWCLCETERYLTEPLTARVHALPVNRVLLSQMPSRVDAAA